MLELLRERIAEIKGLPLARRQVIAAHFQDPVASKTSWLPLRSGGANVSTHDLLRVSAQRLEMRASGKVKFFYGLFIVILGIAWAALTSWGLGAGGLWVFVGGQVCGALAVLTVRQWLMWSLFDRDIGYFWQGVGSGPRDARAAASHKSAIPLAEVYAVQILPERVSQSRHDHRDASYISYELNLVRRDGSRVHVVDHAGGGQIRRDAEQIAALLGVPLWDACEVPSAEAPT
jgi:hypothetical protein